MLAQQRTEAGGQLPQGQAVTVHDLVEHGLQGHGFFQVIGARAGRCFVGDRRQQQLALPGLPQVGKCVEELFHEHALEVLALEAQVAHGFKKNIVVGAAAGFVGHLEQSVVGVIEQLLQPPVELLRGLVTHLQHNHRQAGERRRHRLCGDPVDRHHLCVIVHAGLLERRGSVL